MVCGRTESRHFDYDYVFTIIMISILCIVLGCSMPMPVPLLWWYARIHKQHNDGGRRRRRGGRAASGDRPIHIYRWEKSQNKTRSRNRVPAVLLGEKARREMKQPQTKHRIRITFIYPTLLIYLISLLHSLVCIFFFFSVCILFHFLLLFFFVSFDSAL